MTLSPARSALRRARPPRATARSCGTGRSQISAECARRSRCACTSCAWPSIDADGLEDAVATLRAELADAESRSSRVDDRERAAKSVRGSSGCRGIDHEGEAPGHASSLRAMPGMPAPGPRLHWNSRAAVTPGSIFCRCERLRAERRSAARHYCARPPERLSRRDCIHASTGVLRPDSCGAAASAAVRSATRGAKARRTPARSVA